MSPFEAVASSSLKYRSEWLLSSPCLGRRDLAEGIFRAVSERGRCSLGLRPPRLPPAPPWPCPQGWREEVGIALQTCFWLPGSPGPRHCDPPSFWESGNSVSTPFPTIQDSLRLRGDCEGHSKAALPPNSRKPLFEELGPPHIVFPRQGLLSSEDILKQLCPEGIRAGGSLIAFLEETAWLFEKLDTCLSKRLEKEQEAASVVRKPIWVTVSQVFG